MWRTENIQLLDASLFVGIEAAQPARQADATSPALTEVCLWHLEATLKWRLCGRSLHAHGVGNVRVCNHSPVILGNIKHDRFTDLYYNHPYVHRFRETWPAECANCDSELKELCGGGCKAAAEQCYGTLERVDPFVTLSQQQRDGCFDSPRN